MKVQRPIIAAKDESKSNLMNSVPRWLSSPGVTSEAVFFFRDDCKLFDHILCKMNYLTPIPH